MSAFDRFSCFRIGALSRRVGRYWNTRLAELDLTLSQLYVLLCLLERDGQSVKEIAAAVQLDSSAITGLVDRLLRENRVIRREDPEDRRSLQIYLTENGRTTAQAAHRIAAQANDRFSTFLQGDELDRLMKAQEELEKHVSDDQ